MSTDAVILAAGYASRAHAFKMKFLIQEKAVIQHVVEAFLPVCETVYVVGGFQYERLIPLLEPYGSKVKLIINENYQNGMFSSVQAGIKYVTGLQFFITPGDYPLITTEVCKALLMSGKPYAIPSFNKKGGHPILLSSECIGELLLEREDSNLKKFLSKKPMEYVEVEEEGILYDLDTKEDYITLQERMKNRTMGGGRDGE